MYTPLSFTIFLLFLIFLSIFNIHEYANLIICGYANLIVGIFEHWMKVKRLNIHLVPS